jgi:anti-sigma factor RsiW
MKCRDVQRLLQPHSDGELDLVRRLEIDEHLSGCADCAEQEQHLRSLRAALSSPSLYHRAPAALRIVIPSASSPIPRRRRSSLRLAALAAGVLLLIGASAAMILSPAGASADDRITERVVASHARSLQVEHLRDVVSTDGHTVKPWFRGKIDFSPEVPDLSPQGYALSGGRLDYLADRPVAAIVYYRRLHAINVFTWPAANDGDKSARGQTRQGFHIRNWQRSGMIYWAISDLNDRELDEFVRLFQEQSSDRSSHRSS